MRTLAPWEANRWFFLPAASVVPLVAGTVKQLISGDPMRVGLLLMDAGGGQTAWVYGIDQATSGTNGQRFPVNLGPVLMTHRDYGPLVQMPWFGFAPAGNVNVTVVPLILRDWPEPDPHDNMDVKDYMDYIASELKGMKGGANGAGGWPVYAPQEGQNQPG